jgi:hypothetical protein
MADYTINEFGEIVFNNGARKQEIDPLWEEYIKLEYEVLNNHHNPTKDPVKIARYNELKKILDIKKSEEALNKAKEKIKQKLIASNNPNDKAAVFTAITQFKKTNE